MRLPLKSWTFSIKCRWVQYSALDAAVLWPCYNRNPTNPFLSPQLTIRTMSLFRRNTSGISRSWWKKFGIAATWSEYTPSPRGRFPTTKSPLYCIQRVLPLKSSATDCTKESWQTSTMPGCGVSLQSTNRKGVVKSISCATKILFKSSRRYSKNWDETGWSLDSCFWVNATVSLRRSL